MTAAPSYMTPRLERWRKATDGPLLIVAVASLPMLMLEFARDDLPLSDKRLLDAVNIFVLIAFAVDYFVELRLASRRGVFVRREWTSLLIVVTQALAVVPGLSAFGVLRVLRATPALRGLIVLLRLVAIGGSAAREGRQIVRRRAGTFALTLAGLVWISSAAAFTLAEGVGVDNDRASSFFDALWWSAATITTVGYGDIFPVTTAGRIVGVVTMVVGVAVFAIVTAKIAEFLVTGQDDEPIAQAEPLAGAIEP